MAAPPAANPAAMQPPSVTDVVIVGALAAIQTELTPQAPARLA